VVVLGAGVEGANGFGSKSSFSDLLCIGAFTSSFSGTFSEGYSRRVFLIGS